MTTTAAPTRVAGAFPLQYMIVAFSFTRDLWWPAVLEERGLISLGVLLDSGIPGGVVA